MARNWQKWMPFHIDRFRGSPDVQVMHPAARMGFLYLLASAWQTDDCTVSADPIDLATESGLGDELWATYGPRIMRKFEVIEGRARNLVLFGEWSEAKRVFDARSQAANRLNSERSPRTKESVTERSPLRSLDTQTKTETGTEKEQNPLASTAHAVPADRGKLLGTLPCTGGVEYEVCQDDFERDVGLFPGVDVAQEYRNMKAWLLASPKRQKTKSGIRRFMASWLTRAQDTPKPQGVSNGKFAGKTESSLDAAQQARDFIRARGQAERNSGNTGEAGYPAPSEIGNGRLLGAG